MRYRLSAPLIAFLLAATTPVFAVEHDVGMHAGHGAAPPADQGAHGAAARDMHSGHSPDAETVPVENPFDEANALKISQAAIGREVSGYSLRDTNGRVVSLERYRGRPLVVSLIYTSCYHICPTTTRHLAGVLQKARVALGDQSFQAVTIGFDTANDTPEAMRRFAREQGMDEVAGWDVLSGDPETMARLSENLGFLYRASPKGFDHLVQTTLIDAAGRVRAQVYGMNFETPQLMEPLKRMALGEAPAPTVMHGAWNRVKLFCTTYDPATDSYRFDYSLFVGIVIGMMIVGGGIAFLLREMMRARRLSSSSAS